jgi:hypothetical protein
MSDLVNYLNIGYVPVSCLLSPSPKKQLVESDYMVQRPDLGKAWSLLGQKLLHRLNKVRQLEFYWDEPSHIVSPLNFHESTIFENGKPFVHRVVQGYM